jgi:hypothetical protein
MGRLFDSLRGALRAHGAKESLGSMDKIEQLGAIDSAESLMEHVVSGAEIDPNDPDFAPVEGVDVDQYARICKAIVDAGPQPDELKALPIVAEHGVDASRWTQIAEVWNERVLRSGPVKMRYSATFIGQP